MRVRVLVSLLVAVLLCSAAPAAAKPLKVPKAWIGMLADDPVFDSRVDLDRQLRAMRRAGVHSVRVPFYGAQVQPVEGGPRDFSRQDRLMLAAARAELRVLPVILSVPVWARQTAGVLFSGPTEDKGVDWYTAYCAELVRRYGPGGTLWSEHPEVRPRPVRRWQIWNEPDGDSFWYEATRLDDYRRLLSRASAAIRRADRRAKIMLGGIFHTDGGDLLRYLYRKRSRHLFDEVAVHPFTFEVGNVVRSVRITRQLMKRNGDARKPIALTEISWPTAYDRVPKQSHFGFEVTEREQVAKIRSAYRQLARARKELRISAVYWASWLSTDSGTFPFNYSGLRRLGPDFRIANKPGYYAFRRVVRELTR